MVKIQFDFCILFVILYHISTKWNNLAFFQRKTAIAVVFLLGASFLNLLFFGKVEQLKAGDQLLGGPTESIIDESGYVILQNAFLVSNNNLIEASDAYENKGLGNHSYLSDNDLPDLKSYFSIPAAGWNWGALHNKNAVDIASICGSPIYAAAEGTIAEAREGEWNNGYGSYIVINHPNDTYTKYAHNRKNLVSVGQYILRGDLIAYMGNTGNTHGPTGCHLHFEAWGARNPFAKR